MTMHTFVCFALLLFCTQFSNQASHHSIEDKPPIILILDGSGSMWGQIDGKTKIAIARDVVGTLMDQMDPGIPVGLVAYGHRTKGDCADIENLLEPQTGNRQDIKTSLASLNPVGMTPLASTAMQVIDKLKKDGTKATIILVSDGAESCGGDLCAVIRAAKEAGVEFVLHIVGFDIGESDKEALECAARAGEGTYLDAENGDQLSAALEQATQLTVEETEASFGVKVTKDGILHDAVIRVYKPGESDELMSMRSYNSENYNPAMFHLPSGTYDVQVTPLGSDVASIWRKGIVVPVDEIPIEEVDFTAGNVSILATGNGVLWDCTVSIYSAGITTGRSAGGRTYTSPTSNPMVKELTPGLYDIYVKALKIDNAGIEKVFKNVEINPRQTTVLEHAFEYGSISVLTTNNDALWDCTVNIYQAEGKKQSVGGGRTYTSSSSNPLVQNLSEGKYNIYLKALKVGGEGWEKEISGVQIRPGETTEVAHTFKTGKVLIGARHNDQPWDSMVTITQGGKAVDSGRIYPSESSNPKEFILIEGTYKVTVKPIKLDSPQKEFTIALIAGDTVEEIAIF